MIDFGPVIAVHGSRGVIESRQQIGLDIPNLGRVIIQAVEHILHMREVHFQEAAFYHLAGVVIPGGYMAAGRGPSATSSQPVRPHAHTHTGGQEPQIQYFL